MASVIVRLADNRVVDASDSDDVNWDTRYYENLHPATNPVPAGENPLKYEKDGNGDIVKRPFPELIKEFPDEYVANIKANWTTLKAAIPDTEPWKQALIDLAMALGWE